MLKLVKTNVVSDRFKIVCEVPEPATYEAFLYQIEVTTTRSSTLKSKTYVGKKNGQISDVPSKYMHSSTSSELKEDLENPDNDILYRVLAFGATKEIANMEHTFLKNVDAGKSEDYYNKRSHGGGNNVDLSSEIAAKKDLELSDIIFNNIKNKIYPERFYNRNELTVMKSFQSRDELIIQEHKNKLLNGFYSAKVHEIDPIVILMPDPKKASVLSIDQHVIWDGSHRVAVCRDIDTMSGLNAIQVPFEHHCEISTAGKQDLGLRFNPPVEKPTLDNSNATYANAIVNKIRQYNLYTSQLPVGVRVPDYKHSIIEDALER